MWQKVIFNMHNTKVWNGFKETFFRPNFLFLDYGATKLPNQYTDFCLTLLKSPV